MQSVLDDRWFHSSVHRRVRSTRCGTDPDAPLTDMSSSEVKVTVVQTAEELQGAVQHSAQHIEIRQHIDLTSSEPLNGQQHIVKKILGWPGAGVESIRVRFQCAIPPARRPCFACPLCALQMRVNYCVLQTRSSC